jgi:hypothetical protein
MAMLRNVTPVGVGDNLDQFTRMGGPFGEWRAG